MASERFAPRLAKLKPWLVHGIAAAFYASVLATVALTSVSVVYQRGSLTLLLLLYLGLGCTLHGSAQSAMQHVPRLAPLVALGVGILAVLHLREQFRVPQSWLGVALLGLLVGVAVLSLEHRLHRRWPLPALAPTIAGLGLFVGILLVGWLAAPTFRWHLLRHNTLIGTPLYYLAAEPVPELRSELFDAHRGTTPDLARVGGEPDRTGSPPPQRPSPPIVWLMIDTLRTDSLAAWRDDPTVASRMPYLDSLADRSVRFGDVVANSSWTRPSIASMFTGLLPEEHGARDLSDPLEPEVETVAERLQSDGYETVAFVSNVAAVGRQAGFSQGFDLFLEIEGDPYARADEVNLRVDAFLEQWQARDASERRRPVFAYLHYLDPHEPYLSGEAPRHETPAAFRRAYDAELRYLDQKLSEIVPRVADALGENTVVVVTSDHGEEFWEHGLFGHAHSLYDEVVRVPIFVYRPRAAEGTTIDERLSGRDLYSLVLALEEGLEPEVWAAGRGRVERYLSLYYTGEGRLLLRPYRRHNLMRAVDRMEHRFIWSAYGPTRELYDQIHDPRQLRNVMGSHRELAAQMELSLDEHPQGWRFPSPIESDGRALEQLRALGYVE